MNKTCSSDCPINAKHENLLRQIEVREIALKSAKVMIRILSPTGINIFDNEFRGELDRRAVDRQGNLLATIAMVHPDDKSRILDFFHATFSQTSGNETEPFEYRYRTRNGRYRWSRAIGRLVSREGAPAYAVYTIWDITESKQMEDQLHALAERLHTIREDERTRIAREIHDEFGQALTGLKFELAMLFKKITPQNSQAVQKARELMTGIDDTIQLVRKISTDLRPPILDDFGLKDAVEWLAEDFEKKSGITIQLRVALPEPSTIPKEQTTPIFRILQEALTNVARHSGATTVEIDIDYRNASFSLRIRDNGRGIKKDEISGKNSLGIMGMKERAFALGASFAIGAVGETGTLIELTLPSLPTGQT